MPIIRHVVPLPTPLRRPGGYARIGLAGGHAGELRPLGDDAADVRELRVAPRVGPPALEDQPVFARGVPELRRRAEGVADGQRRVCNRVVAVVQRPRNPVSFLAALRTQWKARGGDLWEAIDRTALLAALAGARLRSTPGTGRIAYSNLGAGVLGHALVAAAGSRDYGELVRTRICGPLGLADTVLVPSPEQAGREAVGHRSRRRPTGHWQVAGLPGAGALRSTADDMLTFLQAQLRPYDTPLGPALALTHAERRPGRRLGIGLGWLRVPLRADDVVLWHNGGTGGFRSFAGFVPAAGVGAVVLANDLGSVDRAGLDVLRALGS